MNCRYVARPFAIIGARSSRHSVAFFLTASQLARSRANSQTFNLPPILTRHRSTAELRVVGMETGRTDSLIEEPTPESNNIAMSCLRIRERRSSSCVGLALSLNVCTRNSKTYIYICMWFYRRVGLYMILRSTKKGAAVYAAAVLL